MCIEENKKFNINILEFDIPSIAGQVHQLIDAKRLIMEMNGRIEAKGGILGRIRKKSEFKSVDFSFDFIVRNPVLKDNGYR